MTARIDDESALSPGLADSGLVQGGACNREGSSRVWSVVAGRRQRTEDEESFSWFFAGEYPQLVRTLSHLVRREDAEDISQEAFARLHQRWAKISRYERPDAWVRRVAINLALSHAKREGRRRERETTRRADDEPRLAPTPTVDTEVMAAIRTLSTRDQALVVLFYFEDRPVAEAAEICRSRQVPRRSPCTGPVSGSPSCCTRRCAMNAENRLDARLRSTLEQQAVRRRRDRHAVGAARVFDRSAGVPAAAHRVRRGRCARGRGRRPRGCGHRPERPRGPAGTGDTHTAHRDVAADADRGRAVVRSLGPSPSRRASPRADHPVGLPADEGATRRRLLRGQ